MKAKTQIIIDTKNNAPHTLPLSTYLRNLLQARLAAAKSDFVFPHQAQPVISWNPENKSIKLWRDLVFTLPCMISDAHSSRLPKVSIFRLMHLKS
jgi:hypothetical protein